MKIFDAQGLPKDGTAGPAGANGTSGTQGPAIFFLADDGEDGQSGPPGTQGPAGPAGSSANITPDTHPSVTDPANDEFETGSSIDTAGTRFAGATAWAWLNQSTATTSVAAGSLVLSGNNSGSISVSAVIQPPSGPTWTYNCKVGMSNAVPGGPNGGVVLYNSGNGHVIVFGMGVSGATNQLNIAVQRFNSTTSFSATQYVSSDGAIIPYAGATRSWYPLYLQITYDGTNLKFAVSLTGVPSTYSQVYSETLAAFMSAITGVGVAVDNNSATVSQYIYDWFRKTA